MPAENCTSASIAYFISRELETSAGAVLEGVQFHKQIKTQNSSLSAMLVRNQLPFKAWLVHLGLLHPTLHGFLGAHFRVLLTWFSGEHNRNSSHWLLFNFGKSGLPRISLTMFLIKVWTWIINLCRWGLSQSFQTEVALIAVEMSLNYSQNKNPLWT